MVPANGEVVTDSISELVLNFEDSIEQESYLVLFSSNGNEIELAEIAVKDNQLIGTLAEPLANDEYKVKLSIIGTDGHLLEGSYTFTMHAKGEEETTQTEQNTVTEDVKSNEEQVTSQETNEGEKSSTVVWIILASVLILMLAIVFFKRKK